MCHYLKMRRCVLVVALVGFAAGLPVARGQSASEATAARLQGIGVNRGLCVVWGDATGRAAVELARASELMLYVQLSDVEDVARARRAVDEAGFYGTRIYVEKGSPQRIGLAGNLADAVIVVGKAAGPTQAEATRVLRPGGKLQIGDKWHVKEAPKGAGEWSHPYHGPDNNPLAKDQIARAPYLTQFLAEPLYCPMPEISVAAGGRMFKAFGHITSKPREWPWMNTLLAINAYNGTILWKRPLQKGFILHRNTLVATPRMLLLGDNDSCKLLDAATGKLLGEIPAGGDLRDSPSWKWMAVEGGVLYALLGRKEPVRADVHEYVVDKGWRWTKLGDGYSWRKEQTWGFGRAVVAIELRTKKVLWTHREPKPLDARAMCMRKGRIYLYSHPHFLTCLDAREGKIVWKSNDAEVLAAIGPHHIAQRAPTGFASTSYLKCTDDALYFAGPTRRRLVAVSAKDGKLLWQYPDGNFQLVLRGDGVYAFGGRPKGDMGGSRKFHPLTGEVLADLGFSRTNCTRATGNADSIFMRGGAGGTIRFVPDTGKPLRLPAMRPACQDGVITAHGLLYWGPWMCDCGSTMRGMICLSPGETLLADLKTTKGGPLERAAAGAGKASTLTVSDADWPTYRGDNARGATTAVNVSEKSVAVQWTHELPEAPTAPIAAGGMVFVGVKDGTVRALDARTGEPRWKAYTAGPVYFPPAVEKGRLYAGSADGWVYALDAATGRRLWRFRAAPMARKIPVYGTLSSTWPVAGGVLVEDGVVYAAAGILHIDGTFVYALDAATGQVRWRSQNANASVQGHLLLYRKRLYVPGGLKGYDVPTYSIADGKPRSSRNRIPWYGRNLVVSGGEVAVSTPRMYGPRMNRWNRQGHFLQVARGDVVIMESRNRTGPVKIQRVKQDVGRFKKADVVWEAASFDRYIGLALAGNALLVCGEKTDKDKAQTPVAFGLGALNVATGEELWRVGLPGAPLDWGVAVDREGRILVTLRDGRVLCYK